MPIIDAREATNSEWSSCFVECKAVTSREDVPQDDHDWQAQHHHQRVAVHKTSMTGCKPRATHTNMPKGDFLRLSLCFGALYLPCYVELEPSVDNTAAFGKDTVQLVNLPSSD